MDSPMDKNVPHWTASGWLPSRKINDVLIWICPGRWTRWCETTSAAHVSRRWGFKSVGGFDHYAHVLNQQKRI